MNIGLKFSDIFSLVRDSLSEGSIVHESAVLLSAIICLIAIVGWYARVSSGESGEGHLPVLRAAAIAFAVCYFPSVVLGPLDGITSAVAKSIEAGIEGRNSGLDDRVSEAYEESERAYSEASLEAQFDSMEEDSSQNEESEDTSFWGKVKDNVFSIISKIGGHGLLDFKLTSNVLSAFVRMIATLSRAVLSVVSGMYLILLGEVGPLVFALSILPSFRSSIHSWISKYIQVSFWVPMCSFFEFMGTLAKESVVDIFERGDLYHKMVFPSYQFTVIDLAVIILILSTPKVCSWLIGGAGPGVFGRVADLGRSVSMRKAGL